MLIEDKKGWTYMHALKHLILLFIKYLYLIKYCTYFTVLSMPNTPKLVLTPEKAAK